GLFMRKGEASLILINSARTLGHQNFTAAHEFYHLQYNPEMTGRACKIMDFNTKSEIEREADLYAAYFLAPDDAIKKVLKNLSSPVDIADVIFLEQFFGMSHRAMLIRLQELGVLDSDRAEQMSKRVITIARELGYDDSLYHRTNDRVVLSDYAEKAKRALELGLISSGRYEEMLLEAGLEDIIYGVEDGESDDEAFSV
ncbi:MAG: ImmA/IrrE family metallo-endopeptidase, partial [Candidatus Saccharicenans sp.]